MIYIILVFLIFILAIINFYHFTVEINESYDEIVFLVHYTKHPRYTNCYKRVTKKLFTIRKIMKRVLYLLIIWFILSGWLLSIAYNLLTTSSDIANCLGIAIVIIVLVVSIETKCLTIFKKKEK